MKLWWIYLWKVFKNIQASFYILLKLFFPKGKLVVYSWLLPGYHLSWPNMHLREIMLLSITKEFWLISAEDGNSRSLFRYCCRSTGVHYRVLHSSQHVQLHLESAPVSPLFLPTACCKCDINLEGDEAHITLGTGIRWHCPRLHAKSLFLKAGYVLCSLQIRITFVKLPLPVYLSPETAMFCSVFY